MRFICEYLIYINSIQSEIRAGYGKRIAGKKEKVSSIMMRP